MKIEKQEHENGREKDEELRRIMDRQHITPEQLSARIPITEGRLEEILDGSEPTAEEIARIAEALLLSRSELDELIRGRKNDGREARA